MGFMAEAAILKTIEKGNKDLAALLAAQQETNRLLGLVVQALSAQPSVAPQAPTTTTWGRP